MTNGDQQILSFKTQKEWEHWLAKKHSTAQEVWIKFFKKASGIPTVTYDEALDEALCYGWIDGKVKSLDEKSYIQRYTPRRAKSIWSKRNTEHIERLTKLGKMKPSGLAEVERAKADGRWEQAYASTAGAKPPEDFVKELSKNKKAREFFETLNKSNKYAMIWQINTAKRQETRQRRIVKFIGMLEKNQKLY